MKKITLSLFIIGLAAIILTLFFAQAGKKIATTSSLQPIVKTELTPTKITETHIQQQPTDATLKEFSLPQDLKAELSEAANKGEVKAEWGEGKISKEELQEAGLAISQVAASQIDNKIKNITAGYSVADKAFAEKLNACLPALDNSDSEEDKILKSEALSSMGFSMLMEQKPEQAEKAFTALIRDYPDTQAAPVAQLELARLISEQGRTEEAQQLVDKAVSQYSSDKEYLTTAQALKKEIEAND